jgi:hypothetical protein
MEKTLIKLGALAEKIDKMSASCLDHYIPVHEIYFDSLEIVHFKNNICPMKPIAQRAICNRLGIPYQYLSKCPPAIQGVNLNHWIRHERNEKLLFRLDNNDVRAIFTPKYTPVDNFEVIGCLYDMRFTPETRVQCHLDDEFMSISIPDYERSFDINGDKFRPGLTISNSEVGLASLSIAAFILRLVCTNGLISKTSVDASYRHVSNRILNEFPSVVEKVSSELSEQKAKLKFSMESPVSDPLRTIEVFNKQFVLRKNEIDAVALAWPYEAGGMMFHIVNTYTRAAQYDGLPAESSYRLEKIGGNILEMLN